MASAVAAPKTFAQAALSGAHRSSRSAKQNGGLVRDEKGRDVRHQNIVAARGMC